MSEIIIAVSIFIVGQFVLEIIIKPIIEFNKLKAKIIFSIYYYARYYSNPMITDNIDLNDPLFLRRQKASDEVRKLSSELSVYSVSNIFVKLFIPSKKNIEYISRQLMGYSNSFEGPKDNDFNKIEIISMLSKNRFVFFILIKYKHIKKYCQKNN